MHVRTLFLAISAALLVVFVGVLFMLTRQVEQNLASNSSEFGTVITVGDVPIKVGIADTEEERARGLSGTLPTPPRSLLFIFESEDTWGIWMKDMQYPIDALWISEDMKVVYIEENMLPASYPRVYRPNTPVRYVLELPAGFVEVHGLKKGSVVSLGSVR